VLSVGWSKSYKLFGLSLGGLHSQDGTTVLVTVSLPLGPKGFASSSLQRQGTTSMLRSEYATAPVTDHGVAWRLGATRTQTDGSPGQHAYFGSVDSRTPWGEHGLDLEARPDGNAVRLRTAGSVGILAGHTFVGPPVSGGFALVSTGDAPGIPVYRWNLPVAVSDSRGLALVTNLSPYQDNLLAVKPEEVPMEYRVSSNEVTAVPRGRGGVYVEFAMLREHPAVLLLVLPGGLPVPPGANVRVVATGETASVGLRGEAYLLDLPERAEVEVTNRGGLCRVTVTRPAGKDPQPRLGPYVCTLERRP
jgi:outer membrane usher protein